MSHTGIQQPRVHVDPTTIRISVVVPFYNSERYIEDCIHALLAQTYPSSLYEVIMVDNNSMDGSVAIVRKYSRIKLLSEQKQGAYAARNRGITEAKGTIIAFTDPDCTPAADWLKQVEAAIRSSAAAIVVGRQHTAKVSPILRMLEDYENEKNDYVFNGTKKRLYYGHTNNMAVRKKVFEELGPFFEMTRGSDSALVRSCVDRHSCDSVCYAPEMRVRHMEIDSAWSYFQKAFVYGKSIKSYGPIANARAISSWERFLVFRNTVKNQEYSWTRSAFLLGLLLIGLLYWTLGGISAALISQRMVVSERPRERL